MNTTTLTVRKATRIPAFPVLAMTLLLGAAGTLLAQEPASAFRSTELAPGVWRIGESNDSRFMYLVAGNKRALLIDTGMATGDLGAFVKTLTKLPVLVVNTHGHGDHTRGNKYFGAFFAHPADIEMVKYSSGNDAAITPVKEGYIFDLGGIKLTVLDAPGHTPGCICLLDATHKFLFAGDDCCPHTWLFLPESLSVETYVRSQEKLLKRRAEFDYLYPGHGGPFHTNMLDNLIILGNKIINGEADVMKYVNSGFTASAASYQGALIAFDQQKLRDKK